MGTEQDTATQSCCPPPLCDSIVEAVLDSHNNWDAAAESRATGLIQSVQHFLPPGQDLLPSFSVEELQRNQELDPGISTVMPFLNRRRRPSRRERDGLDSSALVLIRPWKRLKVVDGVGQDNRGRREQFTMRDSAYFGLEWSVRLKAMSSAVRGASWPRHQILLPELRLKVSGIQSYGTVVFGFLDCRR